MPVFTKSKASGVPGPVFCSTVPNALVVTAVHANAGACPVTVIPPVLVVAVPPAVQVRANEVESKPEV